MLKVNLNHEILDFSDVNDNKNIFIMGWVLK